ncbi:MAG: magnesium/cobalt transporter CorA [Betaproteobacteria bacterium]|nr:magnesium/cobalt transporter CorA [Betaproteobacteria bacterium]MDH3438085.1 magnesium/cobalt transporter CorA [Betaproteobacteria bacterium]
MIRTILYRPATGGITTGDDELLAAWQREPDALIWADFADNEPEAEKQILVSRFGLHPLAIQDAQRGRHPPKIESFSDNLFILLKGLATSSDKFEFETIQLALFIGQRFVVTRHSGHSRSIDELRQEAEQNKALLAGGPDAVALRLCRIVVDRYTRRLLALEPRLDDLEVEIIASPDDSMLAELIGYKTDLRKFRRVLVYHVQVFSELMKNRQPQVRAERVHEIRDVYEHQERASSLASLYYEVSSDLIEGYISLASHRLNNIIKVLTIITAIFVPLSFLAGVYGMNFEYMPELKSHAGYFVLLGIMASIATFLVVLFHRKRWL